MRRSAHWLMVVALPALFVACGQDHGREFESPDATRDSAQIPPPTLPPATDAPPSPATPPTSPEPARSPYDLEDLTQLPPLVSIADANQRLLETARRAMIQARSELDGRNFAMATEHVEVASDALRQARRGAREGSGQARAIDQALAFLAAEMPGTPARATELIQTIATARGPISAHLPDPHAPTTAGP